MGQQKMVLRPIGKVNNGIKGTGRRDWSNVESDIVIDRAWEEALEGLEEFSHLVVLYWMHKAPAQPPPTRVHPQRREDLPLVGLFATRAPQRPNPLGMSIVRLLGRQGNVLKVIGLDAIDGTPVVDIKGYLPGDWVAQVRVPQWVTQLRDVDWHTLC